MADKYQNNMNRNAENQQAEQGGVLPPQAVEIEEAVLGGMLIESEAATTALELLRPNDFYRRSHQHIFEVMHELYEKQNPLDILTVESELRDKGLLEECGGSGYLSELTRSVSSAANIEYHAQIIAEKAIKRNIISSFTDVIRESYDSASDPYELLDKAEKTLYELANQNRYSQSNALTDILKDVLEHLENIRGQKGGITGVPSGTDVDNMTAGWQNGDLIIIAARPSMGKTAFVLTVSRNASLFPVEEKQVPVAIFSLEMSDQQLIQRLLTMEARVDAQAARTGRLKDDEFKRLIEAASRLYKAKIFIDDSPGLSVMEMRSKCRRLKNEHNIGLIVVDYLQLMRGNSNDRNSNREQEIAQISRGLKALAKELSVPVIALSQLSRAVEQRGGNKRPQLSDLRESGSIEQDADVVCFLYRPEYYGITTDDEGHSTAGIGEVIIGKQRNGPVGTIRLQFVKEYARFENLTSYSGMLPEGDINIDPFVEDDPLQQNSARPKLPPAAPDFPMDDDTPF